jgi:hypothetical protein
VSQIPIALCEDDEAERSRFVHTVCQCFCSAALGALQLTVVLIIGFGLHNMTEGFASADPLTGQAVSWKFVSDGANLGVCLPPARTL